MSPKQKVAVISDAACSLPPEVGLEYGVHVVPVYMNFPDKSYLIGVDLKTADFYPLLKASKTLPKTSQPTAQDFLKRFEELSKTHGEMVVVTISEAMSATIQSARQAAEMTEIPVYVVDSRSVSMGQGMIALAAARKAAEGASGAEVAALAESIAPKMHAIFTVDTLEYLHKGGRIGGGAKLLASALDIKPILTVNNGRVEALEKQRTRKRVVARLLEIMEERVGGKPVHAAVLHTNVAEDAAVLAAQVRERFNTVGELVVMDAGPDIATHAGPGTVGLVFYTD